MWNQQMYTWFSRSWIKKLCCFYRWPSFKCEYIYTSAQNLQSRLENVYQAPCICWSCNKNVSVFQCNSSIQKQQKQSAKSKEIVFLSFQVDLFRDAIHVPDSHISWCIFHEVHERDEDLQAHLRKALKIMCQVTAW